jgi:integrase
VPKLLKRHGGTNAAWYFRFTDEAGNRVWVCTHTTDKRLAESIKNERLAQRARIQSGVASTRDYQRSTFLKATIEEQLGIWEESLRSKTSSEKHVVDSLRAVRWVAEFAEWVTIADLNEDGLAAWMSDARARGKSSRTLQKFGRAVKQFGSWLYLADKLSHDPFRRVKLPNPNAGRTHERRMLLPEEWYWLRAYLEQTDQDRFGVCPIERLRLYDFAIQTGLRSSEIRSLKRGNLSVGTSCFVSVSTGRTKNKKPAKQYIRRELAESLDCAKHAEASLLVMPSVYRCAAMLRSDLDAARQWWVKVGNDPSSDFLLVRNAAGKQLDFHSLRHTCGAWLALAGRQPKEIQEVMRHSSIVITLDTYGHLLPNSVAEAVESQGAWLAERAKSGPSAGHRMAVTGTNGPTTCSLDKPLKTKKIPRFGQ